MLAALPQMLSAQRDSGYFTASDGVKVYYETEGTGKAVLLIHGFTGKGTDFKAKPLYDSLRRNGYKIIIADLRGNGRSDKPHNDEAYTNDAEARDLMGLLSFLKIKNYQAIGYSRGSIILARLLVLDPRLQSAVIGGMGADFTNPQWPRRIGIYKALMFDSIGEHDNFKKNIESRGLDRIALAYQQKWQPSTSAAELTKVKQRVLIINGDQDADNGQGRELQQLIPNSTFKEVPGNHGSALGTVQFAELVITFLAED